MAEPTNSQNEGVSESKLKTFFVKIRKYFVEFFMIFLAVILSFFVENIREDYNEHNQARELAKSLVDDLVTDSLEIQSLFKRSEVTLKNLDTLIALLGDPEARKKEGGKIYVLGLSSISNLRVHPHEANLQQIINSGYLHTFKNKKVIQLLGQWSNYLVRIGLRQEFNFTYKDETEKATYKVLDQTVFSNLRKLNRDGDFSKIDSIRKINISLFTEDRVAINEYLGWCSKIRAANGDYTENFLPSSLLTLRELIKELKAEFDLE